MHRRTVRWLALLFVIGITLLACDLGSVASSRPTVTVVAPPSGSTFREGDDISVTSNSTDSSGITRVELLVDGAVVRSDTAPSLQASFQLVQTWKATSGSHTIAVRAYNAGNTSSDLAAVSITVTGSGASVPPTLIANVPTTPTIIPPTTAPPTVIGPTVPGACTNNAAFVSDVTVPDNTSYAAGQAFNKIWRLRNTGTCAWGAGYQFVSVGGEAMSATKSVSVPATASGATGDLQVAMTAPATPGTHTGQWRLKSPQGAFFGTTVYVTIIVPGPGPSPTTPPPTAASCTGTPSIASFTASPSTITAGASVTLSWGAVTNAESVDIDQGIGGVATPGSTTVTPGTTTTYTMTAHCGTTVATAQVVVTVNPAVVLPGIPSMTSPAEGAVFRVFPRAATFTWGTVSFPGGVTYNIEIQKNTGTWVSHVTENGIAGTSYPMVSFSGDNPGRWRVWATSPSAGDGPKSAWRNFSFNTGASQYSGTWLNNDAATSGITRIIISNSGQTLNVNPYRKCTPTDCDWGTRSGTFNGEPFVLGGFPASNQVTITLNDAAGTTLKVLNTWSGGYATYYFHK